MKNRILVLMVILSSSVSNSLYAGFFSKSHPLDAKVKTLKSQAKESADGATRGEYMTRDGANRSNFKGAAKGAEATSNLHREAAGFHKHIADTHRQIAKDHNQTGNPNQAASALRKAAKYDAKAREHETTAKHWDGKKAEFSGKAPK